MAGYESLQQLRSLGMDHIKIFIQGLVSANVFLFLAYLLGAGLGLLLQFPPELISPVWPASGVALAGVLLYGKGAAVGIFCAKVLLHLGLGAYWGEALLLGLGAVFQALVGGYLVRRWVGFPNPLVRAVDVVRFLGWGCLVASLVSASCGVATLWLYGRISLEELLSNWSLWWVGDAIGVVFVTPILLAWLSPPAHRWRQRRGLMTLSLSVTLVLLVGYISAIRYWEGLRIQDRFTHEGRTLYQQLTHLRDQQVGAVEALSRFFQGSEEVTREEFSTYALPLLARTPELQMLSWNPRISAAQRPLFEAQMQQQGFRGYQITERDELGVAVVASPRDEYAPVEFIEPRAVNQRALGYDLYSSLARKQLLAQAQRSDGVAASGVLTLAEDERAGLVLAVAVDTAVSGAVDADRTLGFVVTVLRLGSVLEQLLEAQIKQGVSYRLLDITDPDHAVQIVALGPDAGMTSKLQQPLVQQVEYPVFDAHFNIDFAGRKWLLELVADGRYIIANQHLSAWFLLVSALVAACLAGGFVILMARRDEVEQGAEVVRQREDRFKLAQLALDRIELGIYLIDQQGRFVYVNRAACKGLGYSAQELLAMQLGDVDPSIDPDKLPLYWQRLKQQGQLQCEATHQTKDRQLQRVDVVSNYVECSTGGFNLAFVRDISVRKSYENQLRLLSAAIEQSPVSVLITALDGTIEYVNPALLRITGYSLEEVLGQNPRMFKSDQTDASTYAAMWRTLLAGGGWYGEFCNTCKDGTLIWESAVITPVLDAKGVASHYLAVKENITASRSARERLSHSERLLTRAQSLAHVGSWELDFTSSKMSWSDETCRIFGLSPGSTLDYQGFLSFIHPDDQERLDEAWLSALEGDDYDIEHRIIVEGVIKTLHQRAQFELDPQGRVLRGIGIVHDVTELKRASMALRASEERYRSLINALSEGVLLRDASGHLDMCNPAAERILGRALEVLLANGPGQGGVQFYDSQGAPLTVNQYPSLLTMASGKSSRGVVVGMDRLEGERIWLSVNTDPLYHEGQNQPYAVMISFEDITERYQPKVEDCKRIETQQD